MSIRSIDMQVLIPKATEVGKQQSNIAQQGTLQQQQFAEQMQKTAAVRQQQVQEIVKGQGGKVEREETKDRHTKQSRHYAQSNDKQQKDLLEPDNIEDDASINYDPVLGHIIDIKT